MQNKVLEVKGLKKAFQNHEVLKGIDFYVERGEIFTLLGSNGAGKTTMIKILSTLLCADEGVATICGYDVQKQAQQVKKHISLTGQFAAVDDVLTGRENLLLIARLRRVKQPRLVVDEELARFGLMKAANQRVETYSGGM